MFVGCSGNVSCLCGIGNCCFAVCELSTESVSKLMSKSSVGSQNILNNLAGRRRNGKGVQPSSVNQKSVHKTQIQNNHILQIVKLCVEITVLIILSL